MEKYYILIFAIACFLIIADLALTWYDITYLGAYEGHESANIFLSAFGYVGTAIYMTVLLLALFVVGIIYKEVKVASIIGFLFFIVIEIYAVYLGLNIMIGGA